MGQQVAKEVVKELRNQKGWSQTDLSTLSGLSVKTIQRTERGQGTPSLDTAKALAAVFDRPFSDFLSSPPSIETSAQQHSDSAELNETASSQESAGVHAHLLHGAVRYWRPAIITVFVVTLFGFLTKLYQDMETLSADISEIVTASNIGLASGSSRGTTLFKSNLLRESGNFSHYYGPQATYELQTYDGDEGNVRGVSLLELQSLRDIARIVSAWERSARSNSVVGSQIILRNNLQCYRDARSPSDSVSESIAKMQDCIYVALSDANWQVDHEVDQAFNNLAQAMEETTPDYRALRLNSAQITQQ